MSRRNPIYAVRFLLSDERERDVILAIADAAFFRVRWIYYGQTPSPFHFLVVIDVPQKLLDMWQIAHREGKIPDYYSAAYHTKGGREWRDDVIQDLALRAWGR
jgi:hypothetical protein